MKRITEMRVLWSTIPLLLLLQLCGCGSGAVMQFEEDRRESALERHRQLLALLDGDDVQCDFEIIAVTDSARYAFEPYLCGTKTVDGMRYLHGSTWESGDKPYTYRAIPFGQITTLEIDQCLSMRLRDGSTISLPGEQWSIGITGGEISAINYLESGWVHPLSVPFTSIDGFTQCTADTGMSDTTAALAAIETILTVLGGIITVGFGMLGGMASMAAP